MQWYYRPNTKSGRSPQQCRYVEADYGELGRLSVLYGRFLSYQCHWLILNITVQLFLLNILGSFPQTSEVVIAVPAIHISRIQSMIRPDISIAAEDVGVNGMGAYTGEHSAAMLVDAGVKWTLCGHSERRGGFGGPGESKEIVAKKASNALNAGMSISFCIGEQLTEREAGKTYDVLVEQLTPCVDVISYDQWSNVVIAYEPVWAIGTGVVATPEQAEETHKQIRRWISTAVSPSVAASVRIVYGGSVNGRNCVDLMACPNIDGFLVGGASLKPEFVNIINCTI